jgi:putative endonuclease
MHQYYVYIMTSTTQRLYIGVTNNLERRTFEHKQGLTRGFTSKYKIHRLVYYEYFNDVRYAIQREKQLKGWRRQRKINLIESINPQWRDLVSDFS